MQALLRKIGLRELRLLLLGAGLIVTVTFVAGLIVPKAKALQALQRQINVLQEASLDGPELKVHLLARQQRIDDLEYRLNGDMANLPIRQMEAYIIGRLQRISWDNSIELVSVEPGTGERLQIFQEMLFNVRLSGHYADLHQWLWQARQELGFVVIKEFSLKRQNNVDVDPLLLATLTLASYRAVE